MPWRPSTITQVLEGPRETSTRPFQVMTDEGKAFAKTLGNPEGPHALAREWVGTAAARELGLPTYDIAIVNFDDAAVAMAHAKGAAYVRPGRALVTRYEDGASWDGSAGMLAEVGNLQDCTRMVVLDSWIRNHDRFVMERGNIRRNLENVWLNLEGDEPLLKAIDHTHCFRGRELVASQVAGIANAKDEQVYGCFPEFLPHLQPNTLDDALCRIVPVAATLAAVVDALPMEWEVDRPARRAIREFLSARAAFLVGYLPHELHARSGELPNLEPGATP